MPAQIAKTAALLAGPHWLLLISSAIVQLLPHELWQPGPLELADGMPVRPSSSKHACLHLLLLLGLLFHGRVSRRTYLFKVARSGLSVAVLVQQMLEVQGQLSIQPLLLLKHLL